MQSPESIIVPIRGMLPVHIAILVDFTHTLNPFQADVPNHFIAS